MFLINAFKVRATTLARFNGGVNNANNNGYATILRYMNLVRCLMDFFILDLGCIF